MISVYLATPYTAYYEDGKVNQELMNKRYRDVTKCASVLMLWKYIVFSPITHNHNIVLLNDLPRTYEFWLSYDKQFIYWCDELFVLMVDGWKESKGVNWEINYAKEINKPVRYIEKEILNLPNPIPCYDENFSVLMENKNVEN